MGEERLVASGGIIYTLNEIKKVNIGGDRVSFIINQKENKDLYKRIEHFLKENFDLKTTLGKYGVLINKDGKDYFYTLTKEGKVLIDGDNTVFSQYLKDRVKGDKKRNSEDYLSKNHVKGLLKEVESGFIFLPVDVELKLEEVVQTVSLRKPSEWIEEFIKITDKLGIKKANVEMNKDEIIIKKETYKGVYNQVRKIKWKNSYNSVRELVEGMCVLWRDNKEVYLKPDNKIVRGGRMTLVNLTQAQKDYRSYIDNRVDKTLNQTKGILTKNKIRHSNTTFSSYVTLVSLEGDELKISIRDHSDIYEKGFIRFYIDSKNREDFSKRLALVIDKLMKENKK